MPTDGIKNKNRNIKRVEPILSVPQLRKRYLHGFVALDENGNDITDSTLQTYLDTAIQMLEILLDISIFQTDEEEEKDYFANDYYEWGFFQLNNIPVIKVESLQVTYLRDANGVPENLLDIPKNWIRLREHDGLIRLVPNNAFPAQLQIGSGGSWFPELFRRHSNVPQLWTVKYQAGFEDGKVPVTINTAIGLLAAILAFTNGSDLILGAGIASQSLSIDGLSQSISSTASAENHTYSGKVKGYQSILFGDSINSPNKGLLKMLQDYWQGQRSQML